MTDFHGFLLGEGWWITDSSEDLMKSVDPLLRKMHIPAILHLVVLGKWSMGCRLRISVLWDICLPNLLPSETNTSALRYRRVSFEGGREQGGKRSRQKSES